MLYLCQCRPCAVAELERFGERQAIGVARLLPRVLYLYEIGLDQVLDLTDAAVRAQVGIGIDVLTGPTGPNAKSWVLSPTPSVQEGSTRRRPPAVGDVLAVFVQCVGLGRVEPQLVEEWHSLGQLDP